MIVVGEINLSYHIFIDQMIRQLEDAYPDYMNNHVGIIARSSQPSLGVRQQNMIWGIIENLR
jgi:hypothetical protein